MPSLLFWPINPAFNPVSRPTWLVNGLQPAWRWLQLFAFVSALVVLLAPAFAQDEPLLESWSQPSTRSSLPAATPSGNSVTLPSSAKQPNGKASEVARQTFTLSATVARYLPKAMYGQWSVTSQLVSSNQPDRLPPLIHNIWQLEQQGDDVILSNPENGASATVNVQAVSGNTATFYRLLESKRERLFEKPTVTVEGDRLFGTIEQRLERASGKGLEVMLATYRLEASRLSVPSVQRLPLPPAEFEIAPIQYELSD
ncbi:MAG: hypothetical protein SFZ03_06600 [Candidatus Melainabacteria bacterium]|nr:hypothetical protein [Candidatus Melainabacteria bacterium]